jgi:hypothetical protein
MSKRGVVGRLITRYFVNKSSSHLIYKYWRVVIIVTLMFYDYR